MQEVANSTDDHTLILEHIGTLAVNPFIFAKLPYDANRGELFLVHVPYRGTGPMRKWPAANLVKLETEAMKAAQGSVVKDKLGQESALAVGSSGKEFEAFIKAEQIRWKAVIDRAQIKPDGLG
jgi:hypothetical protein